MKLLVVSQYFWPEDFRINELVRAMVARGHDVTVLTSLPNYPQGVLNSDFAADPQRFASYHGARVVRVWQRVRGQGKLGLVANYLSFALVASLVGPWKLRGQRFDGVFVFQTSPVTVGIPGGLLARIKRVPMLMWILDCWPETLAAIGIGGKRMQRVVGWLVRAIYGSADLLLGQSRGFAANVARYGRADQFRHFPNWVEDIYLAPLPALTAPDGPFTLLFAGNIGEAQDFPAVVDAAQRLRGEAVRLRIVGDGRDLARLQADVAARGLDHMFEFAGRHPAEAMPSFFAQADALLVSLKRDPLFAMTVPGKVQTYLAAGRPILAMLDGEGAQVVRDAGAGLTVAAGDGAGLAAAIHRMMALPLAERVRLGDDGRAYALANFRLATLLDDLEGWFTQASTHSAGLDGDEER